MLGRLARTTSVGLGLMTAAALVGLAPACSSGQSDGPAASGDAVPAAAAAAAAGAPAAGAQIVTASLTYPDTEKGLESWMNAFIAAMLDDEASEKARLLASVRLPDSKGWFAEVFEPKLAERLGAEYAPIHGGIGYLASAVAPLVQKGQTTVRVERFDDPGQPAATGYQKAALGKMKKPVPLYSVRLTTPDGKRPFHVWSFVHHDGTFRFVGKMRKVVNHPPPADSRDPLEYRASDASRVHQLIERR